jgi:hypothetical protein
MKRYLIAVIFPVFIIVICMSCNSNSSSGVNGSSEKDTSGIKYEKGALPVISFAEYSHDFGKLNEGEKVTYAFKFKNTGKAPLIINNVSTSCGCTVSSYPKKPIKPGEGASIDISFDSQGKHGFQSKSITVFTNAQPPVSTLQIQSQIAMPAEK